MLRRLLLIAIVAVALALVVRRGAGPGTTPAATRSTSPTVVLVHGLAGRASNWRAVDDALEPDHRVIVVDLPGHGIARMPDTLTIAGAAALLDRAVADRASGPVVLVGHSVGGLVALQEALAHPERVAGLMLVETALRPQFTPAEARELNRALSRDWAGTLRHVYRGFADDSARADQLAEQALETDPAALRPWIRLALHADLSHEVADLRVPVRVLLTTHSWGERESWATVAEALGYTRAPGLSAERIAGSGHFVMLDQPQALADAIRRFTRDVASNRTASR